MKSKKIIHMCMSMHVVIGFILTRMELSEYVISFCIFLVISIFLHETGHVLCNIIKGYKILYIRFLGVQCTFFPIKGFRISNSWLLESAVMANYFEDVDSDEKMEKIMSDLKLILGSGPLVNVFIICILFFVLLFQGYSAWIVIFLTSNLLVLFSCTLSNRNSYGDLFALKYFEIVKKEIIVTLASQNYSNNGYIDNIREAYLTDIIMKRKVKDKEMIFIMNFLWDRFISNNLEGDFFVCLKDNLFNLYYKNIYLYYKLLCVVAIVVEKQEYAYYNLLVEKIYRDDFIVKILYEESSGAQFFMYKLKKEDQELDGSIQYTRAMYSLGKYY